MLRLSVKSGALACVWRSVATIHRQPCLTAVENGWGKYCVSLWEIETEQKAAIEQSEGAARELGYVQ